MQRVALIEQPPLPLPRPRVRVLDDDDPHEFAKAHRAIDEYEDKVVVAELTPWFCTPQHVPSRPGVYMTTNDPTIEDDTPSRRYRKFFGGQMWSAEFISPALADQATSSHILFPFLWRGLNHHAA